MATAMATNAEALDKQAPSVSDDLPVPPVFSDDESSESTEKNIRVVSKSSEDHADDLLSSLKKLRCDGDFCDVTVICGDFQMKAHRHVLASATEYFKGMFLNETKEAKNGIVDLSTISPEVVKQCMEFIYSGKVDISMLIARDLLDASEMMQLPKLSRLCVEFLAENVDMKSCAEVISLSNRYNKGALDESLEGFLDEYFEEFIESDDFLSMDYKDLMYCLELVGCNYEEEKWDSILAWTRADPHARECHFPKVFKMLDLEFLALGNKKNEICKEELVNDSVECLRLVRDFFLTYDSKRDAFLTYNSKLDIGVMPIPVVSYTKGDRVILGGEIQNGLVAKFPSNITLDMDVIYHYDSIYVGTGLKIYKFTKGIWTAKDVDFTKVSRISPCITCPSCYKDHFYLGDCYHTYKRNDVMWSSQATEGLSMAFDNYPTCRHCYGTTLDKKNSGESCYNRCVGKGNSVYMLTRNYIIENCVSTSRLIHHNLSIGLGNGFFTACGNESIYAIGGNGTECKAMAYDFCTNSITQLTDMSRPKAFGCAYFMDGRLYAADKDSSSETMEIYKFSKKSWVNSKFKMVSSIRKIQFENHLRSMMQKTHMKKG